MVSITEHFVTETVSKAVIDAVPTSTELMEDAQRELLKKVDSTWPNRTAAVQKWFGIKPTEQSAYAKVLAFVEARNSVVHGSGRLTPRQTKSDGGVGVVRQLSAVSIDVIGGAIAIPGEAVLTCSGACCNVIEWFDQNLGVSTRK